ncbi:MAG: phospholipase, partial [bacterium]|nr:phospholipase [bacterium]
MEPKKESIQVSKTARYFLLGEPGPHVRRVWFVCHGYGQLAGDFITNFETIADERHLIAAPEALNRFYMYATRGKVGASWMTKEERLDEIDDYLAYLDSVYSTVMNRLKPFGVPINITALGFSQGAATVSRWVLTGNSHFNRLILWGGDFPPETDWRASRQRVEKLDIELVYGDKDSLMRPTHAEELAFILQRNNVRFQTRTFDGGHFIDP